MLGSCQKILRIEPLNLVGTARCAVHAAFSGATMPPADSRAGTSQRDVPTKVRFMGSPLSFFRMHWNHEPDWHPSPCPLPARRGEGGRRPGEGWFMESPLSFFARIGTMNQIGTPLPALCPQGGERVAEGPERGGSWRAPFRFSHALGP